MRGGMLSGQLTFIGLNLPTACDPSDKANAAPRPWDGNRSIVAEDWVGQN